MIVSCRLPTLILYGLHFPSPTITGHLAIRIRILPSFLLLLARYTYWGEGGYPWVVIIHEAYGIPWWPEFAQHRAMPAHPAELRCAHFSWPFFHPVSTKLNKTNTLFFRFTAFLSCIKLNQEILYANDD